MDVDDAVVSGHQLAGSESKVQAVRSRAQARTKSPSKFRMVTRAKSRLQASLQVIEPDSLVAAMDVATAENALVVSTKRPSPSKASHASIKKARKDAFQSACVKIQRFYRLHLAQEAAREARLQIINEQNSHMFQQISAFREKERRENEAYAKKIERRRVQEEKRRIEEAKRRSKKKVRFVQGNALAQRGRSKVAHSPSDSSEGYTTYEFEEEIDQYTEESFGTDYTEQEVTSDDVDDEK
jgi:hypothetical protein